MMVLVIRSIPTFTKFKSAVKIAELSRTNHSIGRQRKGYHITCISFIAKQNFVLILLGVISWWHSPTWYWGWNNHTGQILLPKGHFKEQNMSINVESKLFFKISSFLFSIWKHAYREHTRCQALSFTCNLR